MTSVIPSYISYLCSLEENKFSPGLSKWALETISHRVEVEIMDNQHPQLRVWPEAGTKKFKTLLDQYNTLKSIIHDLKVKQL